MHFDLHLLLRRDSVEATATCIALDINDTESVSGILADAFECCQSTGVNFRFESFSLFTQPFFILLGF